MGIFPAPFIYQKTMEEKYIQQIDEEDFTKRDIHL